MKDTCSKICYLSYLNLILIYLYCVDELLITVTSTTLGLLLRDKRLLQAIFYEITERWLSQLLSARVVYEIGGWYLVSSIAHRRPILEDSIRFLRIPPVLT